MTEPTPEPLLLQVCDRPEPVEREPSILDRPWRPRDEIVRRHLVALKQEYSYEDAGEGYDAYGDNCYAVPCAFPDLYRAVDDLWPTYPRLGGASWSSCKEEGHGCEGWFELEGRDACELNVLFDQWHEHRARILAIPRWRATGELRELIGARAFRIVGARLLEGCAKVDHRAVPGRHRKVHEIADGQGWVCLYCGVKLIDICEDEDMILDEHGKRLVDPESPKRLPTIDHLVPQSYGGSNRLENLALACQPCNSRKLNA